MLLNRANQIGQKHKNTSYKSYVSKESTYVGFCRNIPRNKSKDGFVALEKVTVLLRVELQGRNWEGRRW